MILTAPSAALAQVPSPERAAEVALARQYAPVLMLKEQEEPCGPGEPYVPMRIDLLLDSDDVALRGPWDTTSIVTIAPGAAELAQGLLGYNLDFPGDALEPGCSYEEWSKRITEGSAPTTYARVTSEAGVPGKIALQYWFFYAFNDFNNKHEGDWEMIQLVFDADGPEQALEVAPSEVGYSQHSGAERAGWGDDKLEIAGGTHPVVFPASGSHANYFSSDLFLGRTSSEGVGCDNTTGPSRELRPAVASVPTDRAQYLAEFPWLGFEGLWGERQPAFFNAPTGPNVKTQWDRPITWSEESWRDQSFAVPAGGALGTEATSYFCGIVETGSEIVRRTTANPARAAFVLGGLAVVLLWALTRTAWKPSTPLRVGRRRRWGQIVTAAMRMTLAHPRVFLGIGLLFLPAGILISLLQALIFRVGFLDSLVTAAGERNAFVASLAFGFGVVISLFVVGIVQAATARAVAGIDAGRPVSAASAYRAVLVDARPLLIALAIAVAALIVLNLTIFLIPVAVYLIVRWALLAVVIGVEGAPVSGLGALRRSSSLTQGHWWRAGSLTLGVLGLALLSGPFIGALALLLTGASFNVVNLIAAVVYVVVMPFAAVVMTYLYFDLRVRHQLEAADPARRGELPSELTV